ncbi:MAG: DUF389 domain-containing protein [Phycisphaerales bacterium]
MPARLIEIVTRRAAAHRPLHRRASTAIHTLENQTIDDRVIFRAVVLAQDVEGVLDPLEKSLKDDPRFQAVVYPLEATLPRSKSRREESKTKRRRSRMSRRAVRRPLRVRAHHARLPRHGRGSQPSPPPSASPTTTPPSSSARDGHRPLLGPNMALSLATTLADLKLAKRALITNTAGLLCAAAFAAIIAIILDLPVDGSEVALRINPKPADIAVALAAGVAGALAATTGVAMSLVGVMVAVALLPPLVVAVMFAVDGNWPEAANAALLLTLNIVCVNLAGVGTFLGQGVRPFGWDEGKRAKRIAFMVLAFWIMVLFAVAGAIVYLSIFGGKLD